MSAVHLTKADFLTRVANYEANPNEWKFLGERPALIDFYATWCGPCKMMEPILEKLSKEKDIKVIKVDVDQHEDLAREYGVMSIPNLFLFQDGKEAKNQVGYLPYEQLEKWF